MEKRYQVFVSSTYADLKEERQKVLQALMEMDCIPAGMELFPASDDEQFQFIKRVIDDCDYYLLIIGGRYGSLSVEGISYTEMEFDYAISKGLRVLAFIHEAPDDLSVAKSDIDPALRKKLAEFRTKASTNRLVKFWRSAAELPGLVALSLQKTIKTYPAVGWVRGGGANNAELLRELNEVRKQNDVYRAKLHNLEAQVPVVSEIQLAGLDEEIPTRIRWERWNGQRSVGYSETVTATWAKIFSAIAPTLQEHPAQVTVQIALGSALHRMSFGSDQPVIVKVDDEDLDTIRIQLIAHDLIKAAYAKTVKGGMGFFWNLTPRGEQLMIQLRTVKTSKSPDKITDN